MFHAIFFHTLVIGVVHSITRLSFLFFLIRCYILTEDKVHVWCYINWRIIGKALIFLSFPRKIASASVDIFICLLLDFLKSILMHSVKEERAFSASRFRCVYRTSAGGYVGLLVHRSIELLVR